MRVVFITRVRTLIAVVVHKDRGIKVITSTGRALAKARMGVQGQMPIGEVRLFSAVVKICGVGIEVTCALGPLVDGPAGVAKGLAGVNLKLAFVG